MGFLSVPLIIVGVVGLAILLACFWFSIRGRKPYENPRVTTRAGVIVSPMNTGLHIAPLGTAVAISPMGIAGDASRNEYVLVPRSMLEQQGVQVVQMPQTAFNPTFHQHDMESIRESSGAYIPSAPIPMMAPAVPQEHYVSTEQEQQARTHPSTPPTSPATASSHAASSQ